MFIATLTFIKPADEVALLREAHVAWLARQFDAGLAIAAGPRPRGQGGVMIARSGDEWSLRSTLAQDPYASGGAARYDILEFTPSRTVAAADILKAL